MEATIKSRPTRIFEALHEAICGRHALHFIARKESTARKETTATLIIRIIRCLNTGTGKAPSRRQLKVLRKKTKFLGNEEMGIAAPLGAAIGKSDATNWNFRRKATDRH